MSREETDGLHITQQHRSGRAMVYDLRNREARMVVKVFEKSSADDPDQFRVEVTTNVCPGVVVEAWGSTRAQALREVSGRWLETAANPPLPSFDWDAVTRVLQAVRAV